MRSDHCCVAEARRVDNLDGFAEARSAEGAG